MTTRAPAGLKMFLSTIGSEKMFLSSIGSEKNVFSTIESEKCFYQLLDLRKKDYWICSGWRPEKTPCSSSDFTHRAR